MLLSLDRKRELSLFHLDHRSFTINALVFSVRLKVRARHLDAASERDLDALLATAQRLDDNVCLWGASSSSRWASNAAWLRHFSPCGCHRLACRSSISIAQIVELFAYERTEASVNLRKRDRGISLDQINSPDVFYSYCTEFDCPPLFSICVRGTTVHNAHVNISLSLLSS